LYGKVMVLATKRVIGADDPPLGLTALTLRCG
jgi:hypothetical protein